MKLLPGIINFLHVFFAVSHSPSNAFLINSGGCEASDEQDDPKYPVVQLHTPRNIYKLRFVLSVKH